LDLLSKSVISEAPKRELPKPPILERVSDEGVASASGVVAVVDPPPQPNKRVAASKAVSRLALPVIEWECLVFTRSLYRKDSELKAGQ
jgi:hypothetical protein